MSQGTVASSWRAARAHPTSYPGDHPTGAFALVDDHVVDLDGSDPRQLDIDGGGSLAELLDRRGLPSVDDRVPVLAYGGNRNPATLDLKLRHYGYRPPGRGHVLPVLPARVQGLDVVAGGLSSQGYLYADIYSDQHTRDTIIDAHVLLLDEDQLRVMHESEGITSDFYDVGVLEKVDLVGTGNNLALTVAALVYVGAMPAFASPLLGTPVAVAAVPARGRHLPAFDNIGLLTHALEACDLVREVAAVVTPDTDPASVDIGDLAAELAKYLNGQWWYRQHTEEPRLRSCDALEALIARRLQQHPASASARDHLAGMTQLLSSDEAFRPDPALRLGRH